MPPISATPQKAHTLPASIRHTKGPTNPDDDECPICHEPITDNAPTLTHDSCQRCFDTECLQAWVNPQPSPTCPICRGELFDIWDLDQHDRFHKVIDALHDIPGLPSSYVVRRTQSQAVDVLHAAAPEKRRGEVEKLLSDAIELAMDAIDFSSQSLFFGHNYPVACAHGIYDSRDRLYKLDAVSVRHLWTGHRVLGQHKWFLLRLPAIPSIALWLPHNTGSQIQALGTLGGLKLWLSEDDLHQLLLEGSKEIVSIPLSTDFLCHSVLPINEVRGDRTEARRIRGLAAEFGTTEWCLIDLRDRVLFMDLPGIFAIPWPKDKLLDGFKTQNYLGQTAVKTFETGGWDQDIEEPLLKRFIAQHALMRYHADYLLGSLDGPSAEKEAEQCRQILQTTYDIVTDEDLRFTDDEKWSTSAGLSPRDINFSVPRSYGDDSAERLGGDEEAGETGDEDGDSIASSLVRDFEVLFDEDPEHGLDMSSAT